MQIALIAILSLSFIAADDMPLKEFISKSNKFAADVCQIISEKPEDNLLVSPLSVELVLACAQSGAKGETSEELHKILHLSNSVQKSLQALLPVFKTDPDYTLQMANKIYAQNAYPIKEQFQASAKSIYGADLENLNFSDGAAAAKTINDWVQNVTNNKIRNLVDPKSLTPNSKMVFVNALYFKAEWLHSFNKDLTSKRDFHKNGKEVIKVDTMQYTGHYPYHESKEFDAKFLEIPFKTDAVRVVFVLPNKLDGAPLLLKNISEILLMNQFQDTRVNLTLPKFRIEQKIDFKVILEKLGVKTSFTEKADFSGISGAKGDLLISEIVQKTFITVAEEGVEAAAATEMMMMAGASLTIPKTEIFHADHPFIFFVKAKGVAIFIGEVSNPSF